MHLFFISQYENIFFRPTCRFFSTCAPDEADLFPLAVPTPIPLIRRLPVNLAGTIIALFN